MVTLTDSNFDDEVMQSEDIWMIEVGSSRLLYFLLLFNIFKFIHYAFLSFSSLFYIRIWLMVQQRHVGCKHISSSRPAAAAPAAGSRGQAPGAARAEPAANTSGEMQDYDIWMA